jgi:antitoxin HicB
MSLARQLAEEMKQKKITKTKIAMKMQTSRSQLNHLLNPDRTKPGYAGLASTVSWIGDFNFCSIFLA